MPAAKPFLDSNVLIYLYSADEPGKRQVAVSLCLSPAVISSQVLNEVANVLSLKFDLPPDDVLGKIDEIADRTELSIVGFSTIRKALQLKKAYRYSYFDSLMLASALENQCDTLYSEDFQDGQTIEGSLQIANPFKYIAPWLVA